MTRVPDDKELGRCGREELLELIRKLRDERDALKVELEVSRDSLRDLAEIYVP